MSFKPNKNGPFCPCGEIAVTAAGTAIPLNVNWSPAYNPNAPVTDAAPEQYAISFDDIIINSPPGNAGGLYIVTYDINGATGSKNSPDSIIAYIPKSSPPISLRGLLGLSRFNPNLLAVDADQNGDKSWIVGVV